MSRLRPLLGLALALVLALVLALGSVTLAVARVTPPVATTVMLCGSGEMLALDADGNPVSPLHLCPDCPGLVLAALDHVAAPLPARPATPARALRPGPALAQAEAPRPAATARGPPLAL